ncbi:hypothetical protein J008_05743 [Cryptococcus neoformans]|nr:hypothetical protein C362_05978 [Cryptococcus neoformans var. grubii Bt1]OXH24518.1 hypothetical protein J008_05743 [Cryptococcus neoformans var. grubii]
MSASNTNAYSAGTSGVDEKGHTYVAGSKADGSAGANAAQTAGDKIKGGWNVFHGTGEGIRGNINSFVDNIGEQIAGRDPAAASQRSTAGGEKPAEVTSKGADEFRTGVQQLKH